MQRCLICNKKLLRWGKYWKMSDDFYNKFLSCKKCHDCTVLEGKIKELKKIKKVSKQ